MPPRKGGILKKLDLYLSFYLTTIRFTSELELLPTFTR